MTLTPEREQKIRERVANATVGPWNWRGSIYEHMEAEIVAVRGLAQLWKSENAIPDADFIAHARQDIPDLLAEIDRLNANLRTVQNAAKTLAAAQGSELEHRRQNANYDHKLRSEHDSLIERDAIMTAENERLSAALTAVEAETAERVERETIERCDIACHPMEAANKALLDTDTANNMPFSEGALFAAKKIRESIRSLHAEYGAKT